MTQIEPLRACGKEIKYDPTLEYGMFSGGIYGTVNFTALQLGLAMADDPTKVINWLEREIETQSHPEEPEQPVTGFPKAFLISIDYFAKDHPNDPEVVHGNIDNTIGLFQNIITTLGEPTEPYPTTHQPDLYRQK